MSRNTVWPFIFSLLAGSLVKPVRAVPGKADAVSASAMQATARALRSSIGAKPTPEDVFSLAKLGDFAGARALAQKSEASSRSELQRQLSIMMIESSLTAGQLGKAESEIQALKARYGLASLWNKLSVQYSAHNQPLGAKRSAFHAASLVRSEEASGVWADVAFQLCQLHEQAAARRLFAYAQKNLLDPDPLMGSPLDDVIEAAARCGFDDIAFGLKGGFPFRAISYWASQNRDEVARRFMEQQVKQQLAQFSRQKVLVQGLSARQVNLASRLFCLWPLAEGQYKRGDLAAAGRTWREIDGLLEAFPQANEWVQLKQENFGHLEAAAQWDAADLSLKELKAHLENFPEQPEVLSKRQTAPKFPAVKAPKIDFSRIHLAALTVVFNPETFDLKQRQVAYERVKPDLLEMASGDDGAQCRALVLLARAERMLGIEHWDSRLKLAEGAALQAKFPKGRGEALSQVAQAIAETGDKVKARAFGLKALAVWQSQPLSSDRTEIIEVLSTCGLIDSAAQIALSLTHSPRSSWEYQWTIIARHSKTAPPRALLQLPPKSRHEALLAWEEGLCSLREENKPADPFGMNRRDYFRSEGTLLKSNACSLVD